MSDYSRFQSQFRDDECQDCKRYVKRIGKLENAIIEERQLSLDAEKKIEKFKSTIQEFLNRKNWVQNYGDQDELIDWSDENFKKLLEDNV